MKSLLTSLLLTAAVAQGQEVIETFNGSYRAFKDEHGRYASLQSDGVVIQYLYDSPSATAESGVAIKVASGVTLTVHYDAQGGLRTAGMPELKVISNPEERTAEIRAGEKPIATFEYRADRYVGAVSIPGHFTMRLTPPDGRHHMHQTVVDANGAVIHETDVLSSSDAVGIWNRMPFEGVVQSLGFDPRSLSYRDNPAGYLTTGRDANGRVMLYLVAAGLKTVGFTPDGVARFYDVTADVFDSDIAPGSDAGVSVAFEQNKAVPAHVTLTSSGNAGLYVGEPASGAIYAAWVESDGRGGTVTKYARATVTH